MHRTLIMVKTYKHKMCATHTKAMCKNIKKLKTAKNIKKLLNKINRQHSI